MMTFTHRPAIVITSLWLVKIKDICRSRNWRTKRMVLPSACISCDLLISRFSACRCIVASTRFWYQGHWVSVRQVKLAHLCLTGVADAFWSQNLGNYILPRTHWRILWLTHYIGWSGGGGQNFFIFLQFSGGNGQIGHPMWNTGSTTALYTFFSGTEVFRIQATDDTPNTRITYSVSPTTYFDIRNPLDGRVYLTQNLDREVSTWDICCNEEVSRWSSIEYSSRVEGHRSLTGGVCYWKCDRIEDADLLPRNILWKRYWVHGLFRSLLGCYLSPYHLSCFSNLSLRVSICTGKQRKNE